MDCSLRDIAYTRRLEEFVYAQSGGRLHRYTEKCQQLAWALLQNGANLLLSYPDPSQLAALDDALLAEKTPQESARIEHEARVAACRHMLLNTQIFGSGGDTSTAIAKCNKCKSSNIRFDTLQTRSADEGMTIFCQCQNPKCGERWTVAG